MGLYIRHGWYYYRRMIQKKRHCRALHIKKGQENFLSERLGQVEQEVIAEHFDLAYERKKSAKFIDYCKKYLESSKHKASWDREHQRLAIIMEAWGDPELATIAREDIQKLENFLFARNLAASTINRYFEILRHLFNQAIEDGFLKTNPVRFYQPFRETGSRRELTDVATLSRCSRLTTIMARMLCRKSSSQP